ncbi:MAG: hypothetical protein Q9185_006031 [Variospora sp. 1 TL-2023]
MSIQLWLDQVPTGQYNHQLLTLTNDPYSDWVTSRWTHPDDDKENVVKLHGDKPDQQPGIPTGKRRLSALMASSHEEVDLTPRPKKKRRQEADDIDPPEHFSPMPAPSEDAASEDVESHHSGRLSPTKQLAFLEDSSKPVIYCDFASTLAEMPEDVHTLCNDVQELADGVGILGFKPDELADITDLDYGGLDHRDRKRLRYPWANDPTQRLKTGKMVPLVEVQRIVASAIRFEEKRAHETTWNEGIHLAVINAALTASTHVTSLAIANVKTASIDPPELANQKLPKRVVDYAIVLQPNQAIENAWEKLQPIGTASIKSWNHTTSAEIRSTPITISIETKAPNKSWTDGKAQIAIWTAALHKRLSMLQQPGQGSLDIPAMPLLIVQGHDWYLFVVSQQQQPSVPEKKKRKITTVIWQKIDIGNTRNCFDAYKLLSVLHLVMDWAYRVWRPWFLELVRWMGDD